MTSLEPRGAYRVAQPALHGGDTLPDAELLARWCVGADSAALEFLIRRHGPMVLGVCRRTLGNNPDADDAFQTTFLILVRKAATLTHPDRVAGWLHGVALRVSRKSRADRSRRYEREVTVVDTAAPEPPEDTRDLRRILDEELDRLPEKYRLPIVLCELEGRTLEEAAQLLGWPKGTVAGRLSRGREMLRQRLSRRRLGLPLFLAGSMPCIERVTPPDMLISATLNSATEAGGTAHVAALASAVLSPRNRWLGLLALLLLLCGASLTLAWAAYPPSGDPAPVPPHLPPAIPTPGAPPAGCHANI